MSEGPTATKRSVLEQLLDQGMVLVALDARVEGVDVPVHLRGDPQLRLNLSYRFGLPMAVEGWGVRATLTFAGVPYTCRFPWAAIFLVVSHVSGQPYLFPDDIPAELLSEAPEMATTLAPQSPAGSSRPKLTVIRNGAASRPAGRGKGRDAAEAKLAPAGKASGERRPSKRRQSGQNGADKGAGETGAAVPPAGEPGAAPPSGRARGHLRLVK